jgi:peptidoglycan/xylan/chitin deacetylase (PgdA/CDA1 family)
VRAILTYHSIDSSGSPISVDQAAFRQHANWLAAGHVEATTLEHLLTLPDDANAVAVTFDDGLETFAEMAWPLLRERDIPVTLFVVTEAVGTDNRWPDDRSSGIPKLRLLDWNELAKLAGEGVTIGSHTRTHVRLTNADVAVQCDELERSRETIRARLNVEAKALAYPYGAVDEAVARAAAEVYRFGCTTELRELASEDSRMLLPRLDSYYLRRSDSLQSWGTARFRRRLAVRAWLRSLRHRH